MLQLCTARTSRANNAAALAATDSLRPATAAPRYCAADSTTGSLLAPTAALMTPPNRRSGWVAGSPSGFACFVHAAWWRGRQPGRCSPPVARALRHSAICRDAPCFGISRWPPAKWTPSSVKCKPARRLCPGRAALCAPACFKPALPEKTDPRTQFPKPPTPPLPATGGGLFGRAGCPRLPAPRNESRSIVGPRAYLPSGWRITCGRRAGGTHERSTFNTRVRGARLCVSFVRGGRFRVHGGRRAWRLLR